MYFEARMHVLRLVKDAEEAAHLIKNGGAEWFEVLQWTVTNQEFLCVADGHPDNAFLEIAFLRKKPDGTLAQVESITAGWIMTAKELANYFIQAQNETTGPTVQLTFGKPQGHERAWFMCGCGNYFNGNIKKQVMFGQDAGYGICNECAYNY